MQAEKREAVTGESPRSRLPLALLLTGIVLFLAGPAQTTPGAVAPRSTVAYDLFAVVRARGVLARGTPGTRVAHSRAGLYEVKFPRPVRGCAAVGNLGYAGGRERFRFQSVVTATPGHQKTVFVDVTYPGDIVTGYPDTPMLRDNAFHLHVDCHHALFANVRADGTTAKASAGVTSSRRRTGRYRLRFGNRHLQGCAPVATAHNPPRRTAESVQVQLALGANLTSLRVSVNQATTRAIDHSFSVIVTCTESPTGLFARSKGFNQTTVPDARSCAFTASWMNYKPGGVPQNQGYVSTWYTSIRSAGVLTKNGGYGVQPGFGTALVATCPG